MALLEVMIASAVLSVFMLGIVTYMSSISKSVAVESRTANVRQDANLAADKIVGALRAAKLVRFPAAGASEVTFVVPVDHDQDGDTFDEGMNVEWGALRPVHDPGEFLDLSHRDASSAYSFTMTFRFVATGSISEAECGRRLNADEDIEDTFSIGHIERVLSAGTSIVDGSLIPGRVQVMTPENIVRVQDAAESSGDGLTGTYYTMRDLAGSSETRIDPEINFDWGSDRPLVGYPQDNFSIEWTGQVLVDFSETYTFYTRTDDGVRLYVGGELIVDNWRDQAPTERSGGIDLEAGERYDITVEYYDRRGGALAELRWRSLSVPKQIIPQSHLFSDDAPEPTGTPIFWLDGSVLHINLVTVSREGGTTLVARVSMAVKLRNN